MKLNPELMKLLSLFMFGAVALSITEGAERGSAGDELIELRREIAHHDELYHRKAAPEIEDAEYDRLRQRLAALEREMPEAAHAAASLAEFGDDRTGLFRTTSHRAPMATLEKAYAPAELRTFHTRLERAMGNRALSYVIEPKYDGLAISVTYENGRFLRAVTRGNGREGDDISANVIQIEGFRRELQRTQGGAAAPGLVELRGEIYVPLAEFERVNNEREMSNEPRFANPRNLAAGTVRQLDSREVARRGLRIVLFGMGACEPLEARPRSQSELLHRIAEWGLPTIERTWSTRGLDEMLVAVDALRLARATLAYPTDGAVIKLDAFAVGENEEALRRSIAYKYAPERVETKLRAITLQVGRTGVLTPVAELAPVQIAGSKVARATLHNREEIARKDIRVGDFVYLEKAGEVIPAVTGVNLARRPATAQPFEFPIVCPGCFSGLVRNDTEVAVRCPNYSCPAQIRRRIEHFASKACVDIEGLGPATVETLVGNGWVKDVPDLYRLRREDLLSQGRSNEKSVDRLLAAIEKSKGAELWRVIHGMGMPQVGASTAKDLARQCGSLAALAESGPRAAAVLAEPRYQEMIAGLIAVGFSSAAAPTSAGRPLAGKTLVLTGTLPTLTRAQAIATIEAAGGKVSGVVSGTTSLLVAGADPGAKLGHARELGIHVVDEAALLALIGTPVEEHADRQNLRESK